jgi:molybdenum cofactor cytidylyltransferase
VSRDITGILLAAGRSRRFPGNKLLHPLPDGLPVAVAAARHLCAAVPEAVVVVDEAASEVANLLEEEGLHVTVNQWAAEGIGTSIACGVAASRNASGWVIALADMPCIPAGIIRQVAEGLRRGADCIAPVFNNRRGHPVGFSSRHGHALMQLSGDEGARSVLDGHSNRVELIETDDKGVIIDIDDAGDLLDAQKFIYGR